MEMDTLTYNRLLRDALILRLKETDKGQEYLKDCWRYQQTEPDIAALRKLDKTTKLGGD